MAVFQHRLSSLVWRHEGRNKQDIVKGEPLPYFFSPPQMAYVYGVEAAPEDAEPAHNLIPFPRMQYLFPYLTTAHDDELLRGQLLKPHGAECVQLRSRYADLGSKPELEPVTEPRGSIDQYSR